MKNLIIASVITAFSGSILGNCEDLFDKITNIYCPSDKPNMAQLDFNGKTYQMSGEQGAFFRGYSGSMIGKNFANIKELPLHGHMSFYFENKYCSCTAKGCAMHRNPVYNRALNKTLP